MSETTEKPGGAPERAALTQEATEDALPSQKKWGSVELGEPSVIVDDVHITYKVFGGRQLSAKGSGPKTFAQRAIRYGRRYVGAVTEVPAIRGVSFVAHRGESIGIVGINGSGKSTVLRAIAGLIKPASGQIFTAGDPSLLGVSAILNSNLTGEQNIMIGGLALGMSYKEVRAKVPEVIKFAGIGDFAYMPMQTYSSGMKSRLRFAISTLDQPEILMIDEALSTGDVTFKERSEQRFGEILENAGTIFLVSHAAATVAAMCTRALWLHQGKLVMDGPAEEVCDRYVAFARSRRSSLVAGANLRPTKDKK